MMHINFFVHSYLLLYVSASLNIIVTFPSMFIQHILIHIALMTSHNGCIDFSKDILFTHKQGKHKIVKSQVLQLAIRPL